MEADSLPALPLGVKHKQEQDYDIVAWSNRNIAINKGLLFAFLAGLLLAIISMLLIINQLSMAFSNGMTFSEQLPIIFGIIVVGVPVVGVLFMFQSLTWFETIKISSQNIIILKSGRVAPKPKKFNKQIVLKFVFQESHDDGHTSTPSLSIVYGEKWGNRPQQREDIAFWMRAKEKHQLFLVLQHILKQRGWNIEQWILTTASSE